RVSCAKRPSSPPASIAPSSRVTINVVLWLIVTTDGPTRTSMPIDRLTSQCAVARVTTPQQRVYRAPNRDWCLRVAQTIYPITMRNPSGMTLALGVSGWLHGDYQEWRYE